MRIDNLEFRQASYFLPKDEWPEHPSWDIIMWYPNDYYGHDDEYPESTTDSNFRVSPKYPNLRIHKSCFKHPESCFTIASFKYDSHEGYYELHFVGDRPIQYLNTPELRETFWELVKYGNEQLNKQKNEDTV